MSVAAVGPPNNEEELRPLDKAGIPAPIQGIIFGYSCDRLDSQFVNLEVQGIFYRSLHQDYLTNPLCKYVAFSGRPYKFPENVGVPFERRYYERVLSGYFFTDPAEPNSENWIRLRALCESRCEHFRDTREIQRQFDQFVKDPNSSLGGYWQGSEKARRERFDAAISALLKFSERVQKLIDAAIAQDRIPANIGGDCGSLDVAGKVAAIIKHFADQEEPRAIQRIRNQERPPTDQGIRYPIPGPDAVAWEVHYFNKTYISPILGNLCFAFSPKDDVYRQRFPRFVGIPAFPARAAPAAAPGPVALAAPAPAPAPVVIPAPVAVAPAPTTSWQRTVRIFNTHRTFFLSLGGASVLAFGLLHGLAGAALAGLGFVTILPLFTWGAIALIRRLT